MSGSGVGEARQPRVWAPRARSVEVIIGEDRLTMARENRGWWSVAAVPAAGSDYCFSLDGGHGRPDPRSAHQPHGVHGPSRVVDHGRFEWGDAGWSGRALSEGVVYEAHVGTFSAEGTFAGFVQRLDHLVDLGVGTVQLMPVAAFAGLRGWGYDAVAAYAPHHAYGGPDGLKLLVDACHAHGLAVMLDVVYNHLGPSGNYLAEFGPYFTDRHTTPWGPAVNFDGPGSDEVRTFVFDNARMWIEDYHVDGLRIDAVHAIHDESAVHVLAELGERVTALATELGRRVSLVAESDLNDPRVIEHRERGGWGLDAQWSDDLHHSLHAVLTGESAGYYGDFGTVGHVAKAIRHGFVVDGTYSGFRDRRHGRPLPPGTPGERLVVHLQTHDQVGNRTQGERIGQLVGHRRARVAAALVLTSPYVPMLFAGEEWGAGTPFRYFTDHEDPGLGDAISEGRLRELTSFGWEVGAVADPQDPRTWSECVLDWDELAQAEHAETLAWYRSLIRLRTEMAELGPGTVGPGGKGAAEVDYDEAARWLIVRRGQVLVAANLGVVTHQLVLDPVCGEVLAASGGATLDGTRVRIPPDSVIVAR